MPGEPLFEYRPASFGPMTVALLFIMLVVTPFAAADRLLAGRPPEAAMAALPLLLTLLYGFLTKPSAARIFDDAIEVPRSRAARMAGSSTRIAMDDIENVFPSFYEDAGMKFSPFASAEGTAKHAGVRIEAKTGERFTLEFTPTVLNLRKKGTPAYREALESIRGARRRAGLPMVKSPPALTEDRAEDMLKQAARPLLPFPVTVTGVLAPAFVIPILLWAASSSLGAVSETVALTLALVGLTPLVAVFAYVNIRARGRARLLHEVQKWREARRESAVPPADG